MSDDAPWWARSQAVFNIVVFAPAWLLSRSERMSTWLAKKLDERSRR